MNNSGKVSTQNLYYNTGNGVAKYNDSISSMTWKAGDGKHCKRLQVYLRRTGPSADFHPYR